MKFNDALIGLGFLALSLIVMLDIRTFPDFQGQRIGPAAFPGLIAVLLLGCSVALIWRGWRERQEQGCVVGYDDGLDFTKPEVEPLQRGELCRLTVRHEYGILDGCEHHSRFACASQGLDRTQGLARVVCSSLSVFQLR